MTDLASSSMAEMIGTCYKKVKRKLPTACLVEFPGQVLERKDI